MIYIYIYIYTHTSCAIHDQLIESPGGLEAVGLCRSQCKKKAMVSTRSCKRIAENMRKGIEYE